MNKFDSDYLRHSKAHGFSKVLSILRHRQLRALWYLRHAENAPSFISKWFSKIGGGILLKDGIEIGSTKNIGGGLMFVHASGITINHRGNIGENLTIFKGATIGSIRSGKKQGVPIIGNRVTICANAMVCGKVTIGDDVLIAAGAYVNFDVPSNSVVIGNPGVIHHKDNPSADYLR